MFERVDCLHGFDFKANNVVKLALATFEPPGLKLGIRYFSVLVGIDFRSEDFEFFIGDLLAELLCDLLKLIEVDKTAFVEVKLVENGFKLGDLLCFFSHKFYRFYQARLKFIIKVKL